MEGFRASWEGPKASWEALGRNGEKQTKKSVLGMLWYHRSSSFTGPLPKKREEEEEEEEKAGRRRGQTEDEPDEPEPDFAE